MKKIIFFAAFLLLFSMLAFATISNYTVPAVVPLNRNITIYGEYTTADILCAFFLFDTEDQNQVIIRLSDEYTFADGSFYSEFQLTEPLFRRGYDYNAVTKCGTSVAAQLFYIDQKEDLAFGITPDAMRTEMAWWLDSENSLTVFLVGIGLLLISALGYSLLRDVFTPS